MFSTCSTRARFALLCLLLLVFPLRASAATPGGLTEYVKKPDPAFDWKVRASLKYPGGTIHDIHLVSQVWQGITWKHQLQVYVPSNSIKKTDTILLWNQGGSANLGSMAMGLRIANNCKVPVAFLYGIPNQPLLGGKSEDALIAETFVRYLKTRDGSWPLLFPMVKSLVRAMDTLEGFSKKKLDQPVKKFIVSGASKRGWTTWLTAAADKRVVGIVPMVIDTLNMGKQMDYQKECFGKYSRQIKDYTERGLVPMPDTATARKLWKMVDPYFYRDHYTMPKLIINGNNDPYWTVDALNLYWAGLPKNKWVLYVPNAGHNLQQRAAEGKRDLTRASNGLAAFVRHQTQNKPMPQLKWKHEDVDGKAKLTAQSTPPPNGARLWMAEAATKDFRKSRWTEGKVDIRNGTLVGLVARPKTGYRAFYMELDYTVDGLPYHLSTQIRVVGK